MCRKIGLPRWCFPRFCNCVARQGDPPPKKSTTDPLDAPPMWPVLAIEHTHKRSCLEKSLTRSLWCSNKLSAHKELLRLQGELQAVEKDQHQQSERILALESGKIDVENEMNTLKLATQRDQCATPSLPSTFSLVVRANFPFDP